MLPSATLSPKKSFCCFGSPSWFFEDFIIWGMHPSYCTHGNESPQQRFYSCLKQRHAVFVSVADAKVKALQV